MNSVQVTNVNIEELKDIISAIVKQSLKEKNKEEKKLLSKREFAEKLGKSNSWVDSERRKGNLNWTKVGGEVRIPRAELEQFEN